MTSTPSLKAMARACELAAQGKQDQFDRRGERWTVEARNREAWIIERLSEASRKLNELHDGERE